MKKFLVILLFALLGRHAFGADEGFLATYYGDTLVGAAQGQVAMRLDPAINFDFVQAPPPRRADRCRCC